MSDTSPLTQRKKDWLKQKSIEPTMRNKLCSFEKIKANFQELDLIKKVIVNGRKGNGYSG